MFIFEFIFLGYFAVFLAFLYIGSFVCFSSKNIGAALFFVVIALAWGYMFKTDVYSTIDYVKNNYDQVILYIVGYIGIGAVWSFGYWFLFLREVRTYVNKLSNDVYALTKVRSEYGLKTFPPVASENKYRIVTAMMYWPISFVWRFIGDIVINLFENIYAMFGNIYQRMSDNMFKDVKLK